MTSHARELCAKLMASDDQKLLQRGELSVKVLGEERMIQFETQLRGQSRKTTCPGHV